jgi:hypothetical protein
MAKRLVRVKRRQRMLAELQVQQLEIRQRLERELFRPVKQPPDLFLETAGVHPHLVDNRQQGPLPEPEPLLLTDRTLTRPLPEPELELEPMPPAEQQLAALLSGHDLQPS